MSRVHTLAVASFVLAASCTPPAPAEREKKTDVKTSVAAAPVRTESAPTPPKPQAAPETVREAGVPRKLSGARSIGNTSVVFKLTFDGGEKAVFKPRSRRGRDRYKGEIAAYRLAKAIGLGTVPEVMPEALPLASLEAALATHLPSVELAKKELSAEKDGLVSGAIIPWIDGLEFIKLEGEPLRSRWRGWLLEATAVPESERALAAQIAAMIVFDSLTGNWDRWSGANVGSRAKTTELVLLDNDGAFMVPTPAPFERQRELLKQLKKYPRGLLGRIRTLDEASLKGTFGEETPGAPLLSDAAVKAVETRRKLVVDEADARIRELGEARVLAFE